MSLYFMLTTLFMNTGDGMKAAFARLSDLTFLFSKYRSANGQLAQTVSVSIVYHLYDELTSFMRTPPRSAEYSVASYWHPVSAAVWCWPGDVGVWCEDLLQNFPDVSTGCAMPSSASSHSHADTHNLSTQ